MAVKERTRIREAGEYTPPKYSKEERQALGLFTPEEYEEYKEREQWKDGFHGGETGTLDITYEDYERYYVAVVDDWIRQSKVHFKSVKKEWAQAVKRFESFVDRVREISASGTDPAYTNLPFLYHGIMEIVAMLFDSLPRPTFQSRQAQVDDFAGALNYFASWELDANDFDMLMYGIGLDVQLFNLGVLKLTVDDTKDGPFSRHGRIEIRKTEPRYCHPDPFASQLDWKYMQFFIESSPYDIGDIRQLYPDAGFRVRPELSYSVSRADEDEGNYIDEVEHSVIDSPSKNPLAGPFSVGERGRAMLNECWLKDDTLIFEAEEEWFQNAVSPDGENQAELIEDAGHGFFKPSIDPDTGYVRGKWVKKYPHGRYIVTANKVLLLDIPNPYPHKGLPYVFFRGRPSKTCLSPGDATYLMLVERKLNDLLNRVMRMAQANIERPTIADGTAFDAPKKWHNIESAADLILQVRPGSKFEKMQAGEIPAFVEPFVQFLQGFMNDLKGVNEVMQGKLSEGSQLSAEALSNLQDQAGTMGRMKARFLEAGLKETGFILMWLIRWTYQSDVTVQIIDPSTKQPADVKWDPDSAGEDDYVCVMHAGSSLPGAKQGAFQQAMSMYRERIVDDEYVLETAQIPGASRVLQRKRQKELEDIYATAAGKALGVSINQVAKTDGAPGRRRLS